MNDEVEHVDGLGAGDDCPLCGGMLRLDGEPVRGTLRCEDCGEGEDSPEFRRAARGRTVDDDALDTGDVTTIAAALATGTGLTETQARVYALRYLLGISRRETAEYLDVSVSAVDDAASRARRKVDDALTTARILATLRSDDDLADEIGTFAAAEREACGLDDARE